MPELLTKEDFDKALKNQLGSPGEFTAPEPEPLPDTVNEADMGRLREQFWERQDESTVIAMRAAQEQAPSLYRKALQHAELYHGEGDLDPDFYFRNQDEFQRRESYERIRRVLRTNPGIQEWFLRADNSRTLEIEDLETISNVAWLIRGPVRSFSQSVERRTVEDIRWNEMWGLASDADILRADALEQTFTYDFGAKHWYSQGLVWAADQLPVQATIIGAGIEGFAIGGASGAVVGSAIGPEGTVAGLLLGGKIGATSYALSASYKMNAANMFSEFRRLRDVDGKLIDKDIVRGAAIIGGLPVAALDALSLGMFFKATGIGAFASKEGAVTAMKQALKDKTFRQIALEVGKRFTAASLVEGATEGGQQIIQIISREVAKVTSDQDFKPTTSKQAMSEVGQAMYQGFLATAFLSVLPAGGRLAAEYTFAQQADTDIATFERMTDIAKNDKLIKEAPEKAAEVMDAALQGSGKEMVYLDVDAVKEFLQEEGPEAVALSKIPDIQQAVTEAVQSGGDVAVPTSHFYAYVAPTDAAAKIIDRLKFQPDGLTKEQARRFMKAIEEIQKDKMTIDETGSVYQDVYSQSREAGHAPEQAKEHAALYSAFFESMGTQTGREAYDVYKSYNIRIERQNNAPGTLDPTGEFAQQMTPEQRSEFNVIREKGYTSKDFKLTKEDTGREDISNWNVKMPGVQDATLVYDDRHDRMYLTGVLAEGKGTELYDRVEAVTGHPLQPDPMELSPQAYRFWQKRAPDEVAEYVQGEDGHWSHPRAREFLQAKEQVIRGAITFHPDKTVIKLFKDANLSTLLHESGHLFLQVMSDLVRGKQAYSGTLFQTDHLKEGDVVQLLDDEGEPILETPARITAIVDHPRLGRQLTVEGSKKIYNAERAYIVSTAEEVQAELEGGTETTDEAALGVPESVEPESQNAGVVPDPAMYGIPEDNKSGEELLFDLLLQTNYGFRKFTEGKPQATDAERKALRFEYFPNSKEAMRERQIAARARDAEDPRFREILKNAGVISDPLGIELIGEAMPTGNMAVERITDILKAAAKLEQALSKRKSEKVLRELHLNFRVVKDEGYDEAWASFEEDLGGLTQGTYLSERLKKVVQDYITKYKSAKAKADEKQQKSEFRKKKDAEKAALKVSKEEIGNAIAELASVVDRVEKIEAAREVNRQLKEDIDTVNSWLGESGPTYSTDAQEKFARAFEAYLFQGQAPNARLARAFERFKQWMKLVYRRITNIGVEATPEVKGVFDRMLTVDEAIANEVASPAFAPSFSTPEEAGMTPEEFAEYLERVEAIAAVGRKAAEQQVVDEAAKRRSTAVQKKRSELRKRYTEEMGQSRPYRVMGWLQGKKIDGLENMKLDRARVKEILGEGKLGSIPNGSRMWAKEGGVDPDFVAGLFGYPSGADMIAEFQATEPLKTAVEKRVEAQMQEITEEQLITPPDVAEMASAKLRSEVYKSFLVSEIRAYNKLLGADFTEAHVVQFKRMADDIIDAKPMRRALRANFVKEFTSADRLIGARLDKAIKAKDFEQVLDLRRKQLFNHFLINRAYEVRDEARKAKTYLTGFAKKKASVIDQVYLSQIRNLLIAFEFIKGKTDETVGSFSNFVDDELIQGNPIVVDPRLKGADRKAYMSMTWGEVAAIRDAVKNLEFVGRNKRKIFKEGRVMDLKMAVAKIAQAMDENLRPAPEPTSLNQSGMGTLKGWFNGYINSHVKIEQLCDWIDGGAAQGPAHKFIFQPFSDAQVREVKMTQKYAQKVLDIMTRKPVDYWNQTFRVQEINRTVKRSEAMAVALNMGNESNLKKLKVGMGWTDAQIQAVVERLDGKDWQAVQNIWDTVNELWPEIIDLTAKLGLPRPDKVEAVPITNKYGTFNGGYYPVVYDPSKSADVLARGLTTQAEQQFGFEPSSMFPPRSFTKDRTDEYARPLMLDMSVLPQHLAKTIHYITHAEPVYNTTKIMNQPDFKDRLLRQFGQTMYESMLGWINNISRGETEVAGLAGWQRFARALRSNITLAALGLRATTVVAQAGGLFAGAEMIGMGNVTRGLREMYGTADFKKISENFEFVRNKSGEMKHRTQFLERDLSYISDAFSGQGKIRRTLRDVALAPMLMADNIIATGVWMGAYTKQLKLQPHDEATAIAFADKVVRLTQGSGAAKDLAAVQRGNEFYRLFTMFYTYFSAYQNRLIDIGRSAMYGRSQDGSYDSPMSPNEATRFLYLVMLPAVLFDFLFKGSLKGEFTDDDDETGQWTDAIWKIFAYTFAGSVVARDLIQYATRDQQWWKFQGTPVMRSVQMALERLDRVIRDATDSERDVKASDVVRTTTDILGLTLGVPADAPSVPLYNYLKTQEQGEDFTLSDFFVRR